MKATIYSGHKTPPAGKITYEEFLAWAAEDVRAEWVEGEVFVMSPAAFLHQNLLEFLSAILRIFVEKHDLGWVVTAPFQMYLPTRPSGREPDLLFVRAANKSRLQRTYLDGPADMVVEIVSPDSIQRDRQDKFAEYEKGKVFEYWLIDPALRQAEFFRMGDDGHYHTVALDAEGRFHSEAVTGFWLKPEWLWQEPLPKVLDVIRELKVI